MTTAVSVLIPYAGTDPHRARALEWVTARYQALGWQVCVGRTDQPGDRFVKADAVALALEEADHDTLVVSDADCWAPGTPKIAAQVDAGAPWGMPHQQVHRLTQIATQGLYDNPGMEPNRRFRPLRVYNGVVGGGVIVIQRQLYEQIPLDPRFVGWGGEDDSWGRALRTLSQPWRRHQDRCFHLWHPSPVPQRRFGSAENNALAGRYKDLWAVENVAGMTDLVEEARCLSKTSSSTRSPSSSPA